MFFWFLYLNKKIIEYNYQIQKHQGFFFQEFSICIFCNFSCLVSFHIVCNTLQHTATHCNTLQHAVTHCNTPQHTAAHCETLEHNATHCNTLQQIATHCNTLGHNATQCNTLQRIVTHCNISKVYCFLLVSFHIIQFLFPKKWSDLKYCTSYTLEYISVHKRV